jgi:hypothetical protein
MIGEVQGDQFGISVSSAGDVNNDGYSDVIVGANANDENGTSAGKAYIYFGGADMDSVPDVELLEVSGEFFGVSVSSAGDVNNDGFDDIIVGAHFNSETALRAGKAYIFLGGSPMDSDPDLVMYGEQQTNYFGISVCCAGDVNQDGYDDVVVGAYRYDYYGAADTLENIGRAYLYYGGASMDSSADVIITGKKEGERFGRSVSSAGDVNQDGYDDVIIGAYSYDSLTQINLGRAYLFYGSSSVDTIADVVMTGELDASYFGWSVSGTDVNSDGYSDIIVGAYGHPYEDTGLADAGKVYVYLGGDPMDNVADFTMTSGRAEPDQFGFCVSGTQDINGDTYPDILVGANGDDEAGTMAGKVHIFYGGASISPLSDDTLMGEASNNQFGRAVSGAGDVDLNFHFDLVIGAWGYDSDKGKVYIYGIPTSSEDITPPAPIKGLKVNSVSNDSIKLEWTATGDDGETGVASFYDLRYSYFAIGTDTASWWLTAEAATGEPTPSIPGNPDSMLVIGTLPDSIYYFIIKAVDEVPNFSGFSNIGYSGPIGDANGDGIASIVDAVYIVNYLFKNGPEPSPMATGDANGDCRVSISDVVYLVNYLFNSGPAPKSGCA